MRGLGFYETIAEPGNEDVFPELSAGLVVFRCAEDALRPSGASAQSVAFARKAVKRLSSLPLRNRLLDILDLADPARSNEESRSRLGGTLLSYGYELHHAGHLSAAIDVFTLLATQFHDEPDIRLAALHRKAFACRLADRFEDAEASYSLLLTFAIDYRDARMELEAQLGFAKLARARGNIPQSAQIIDAVLTRARTLQQSELIGKALIDRGVIAGIRRDPVSVILDMHEALDYVSSESQRDGLMHNMAVAYREIGHAKASAEIAQRVADRAKDFDMQCRGAVLLYHLAIDARDDVAIARIRRRLASTANMPSEQGAEFCEALARDHATYGRFVEAGFAAARMRDAADEAKRAELVFRAETALRDIARGIIPAVYSFRPVETTTAAQERLAAVEESVAKLCEV